MGLLDRLRHSFNGVLVDAPQDPGAQAELPNIFAEVTRLLQVYGSNNSFRSYAVAFQQCLRLLLSQSQDTTASTPPDPAVQGRSHIPEETPMALRLAIGGFARDGRPVPAEWAYSWALPCSASGVSSAGCDSDSRSVPFAAAVSLVAERRLHASRDHRSDRSSRKTISPSSISPVGTKPTRW